jgi:hypothetical protein
MMLVKASTDSEAGAMPSEQELAAMGEYNEEMVNAGVMLEGEGLHPSAKGVRVTFEGGEPKCWVSTKARAHRRRHPQASIRLF